MPLRPHQDVEIALVRGALDGAVEIELVARRAGEFAQAPQRDFDVAGAELDVASRSLDSRLSHTFTRGSCGWRPADAHAFGIVAVSAERRGACRADPFLAAL